MDNEEKYKKLIRAIKILREIKPRDESLEKWIKDYVPDLAETDDERIRKELIDIVAKSPITFAFEDKNKVLSWLEKQGEQKPPMQNGIIINGVEYELIEDREDDECERCALSNICYDARKEVICNPIFGDLSICHRFEKRKL